MYRLSERIERSRRAFLTAVATGGAASLAGCSIPLVGEEDPAEVDPEPDDDDDEEEEPTEIDDEDVAEADDDVLYRVSVDEELAERHGVLEFTGDIEVALSPADGGDDAEDDLDEATTIDTITAVAESPLFEREQSADIGDSSNGSVIVTIPTLPEYDQEFTVTAESAARDRFESAHEVPETSFNLPLQENDHGFGAHYDIRATAPTEADFDWVERHVSSIIDYPFDAVDDAEGVLEYTRHLYYQHLQWMWQYGMSWMLFDWEDSDHVRTVIESFRRDSNADQFGYALRYDVTTHFEEYPVDLDNELHRERFRETLEEIVHQRTFPGYHEHVETNDPLVVISRGDLLSGDVETAAGELLSDVHVSVGLSADCSLSMYPVVSIADTVYPEPPYVFDQRNYSGRLNRAHALAHERFLREVDRTGLASGVDASLVPGFDPRDDIPVRQELETGRFPTEPRSVQQIRSMVSSVQSLYPNTGETFVFSFNNWRNGTAVEPDFSRQDPTNIIDTIGSFDPSDSAPSISEEGLTITVEWDDLHDDPRAMPVEYPGVYAYYVTDYKIVDQDGRIFANRTLRDDPIRDEHFVEGVYPVREVDGLGPAVPIGTGFNDRTSIHIPGMVRDDFRRIELHGAYATREEMEATVRYLTPGDTATRTKIRRIGDAPGRDLLIFDAGKTYG